MRWLILFFVSCLFITVASGKSSKDSADTDSPDWQTEFGVYFDTVKVKTLSDSLLRYHYQLDKQQLLTEIARARYFEKQYQGYFTDSLKHRYETFLWQQTSSKIIFWIVLFVVFIGLLFAAIQFRISMALLKKPVKKKVSDHGGKATAGLETELELSVKGVKINSSVMGVILLCISLAFLYLYLVFVYPIGQVQLKELPESTANVKKR